MIQPSKETVLGVLRSVQWEGRDVVSRGMVSGVTFSDDRAGVTIILEVEPQKNAGFDSLKDHVEKAAKAVAGVSAVNVIFTATKAAQHKHGHSHADTAVPKKVDLPDIKHIVVVASGKGGVGKSTTAVNMAVAFAQKGLKVGLLDADVYGPSIPHMMGVKEEPEENENGQLEPVEKGGVKIMSIGFMIDEAQPMIWRGPMVHSALIQFFRDVAWGELDVLVVDLPPGTGDAQLTLAQSIPVSGAVVVSTPQDIALIDARKALAMFVKTDTPVLGIIENMSYFECPHCKARTEIFSHAGAQTEAQKLDIPFLGEIPLDVALRLKSDEGQPLTLSEPHGAIAQTYHSIADKIWALLDA